MKVAVLKESAPVLVIFVYSANGVFARARCVLVTGLVS